MRTLVIAVSVAAVLLVAAGCGGSSSSADDSTTAIETTDATATDTSDSTETSGGTDTSSDIDTTDSDEDVSLAGCEKLGDLAAKYTEALGAATGAGGKVDLEATAKAYEDFADEVPEEIRDAFKTVAAAFGEYADILEDVDLSAGETPDPDKLAEIAEAMQKLDNTELTAASAEIEAWAKKNCSAGG